MQRTPAVLFLALGAAILSGCATTARSPQAESDAAAAAPAEPREAVSIYDGRGGRTSWAAMLETLRDADVIIIGETHGHPLGLAAAATVWEDTLAARPDTALLMEFFERDEQVALDDYLSGITDEPAFRTASGRSEGNYPPGHRRMVEAAKAAGRPVVAANAPRRYVRRTSPDGYWDLSRLGPEQQRLFAIPDWQPEGRYRDEFFELMSGMDHGAGGAGGGMPPSAIEKMFRSQLLWDSTMADSVARELLRGSRPVVLVVGRFHSDFGGGTVQMLRRMRPDVRVRTLSMVAADPDGLSEEDVGRADFVLYVGD